MVRTFILLTADRKVVFIFFSSRRRHTRYWRDWSSDVCSSDLRAGEARLGARVEVDAGGLERRALEAGEGGAELLVRSEERRVGEECKSWWLPDNLKKNTRDHWIPGRRRRTVCRGP